MKPGEMTAEELLNEVEYSCVVILGGALTQDWAPLKAELLARLNAEGAPQVGWLEFGPNTPPWNAMYRVRISSKDKTTAEWNDGRWLWDACDGAPITDLTSQVTHYKPEAGASRSEVTKPPCHVCGEPMKVKTWSCACGATTGCSEAQPLQASCPKCQGINLEMHFTVCESPCGHSSQYAYSDNGGKQIVCLLCERAASLHMPQKQYAVIKDRQNISLAIEDDERKTHAIERESSSGIERASLAAPQLEQTLRVGMAAGQLCRILNVQDRQGWHWDRFVEILTRCFPPVESPQLEQVARERVAALKMELYHDVDQELQDGKCSETWPEIWRKHVEPFLQRHFPGDDNSSNTKGDNHNPIIEQRRPASGEELLAGENGPPVAAAERCLGAECHIFCPAAPLTPRKEPLGICDSRWHVSRPHLQHLGCINFRPSPTEKGAEK